jgi:hypothetical protein
VFFLAGVVDAFNERDLRAFYRVEVLVYGLAPMATEPKKQEPDIPPKQPDIQPEPRPEEIPQDKDVPEKETPPMQL